MTPKEKAKELITKFRYSREDGHEEIVAKQCATMAVQEILVVLNEVVDHTPNHEVRYNFWNDVKREIQKL